MQRIALYDDWKLLVVSYSEPFAIDDLLAAASAVGPPGAGRGQHQCVLIDVRKVSLARLTGADSRKFAIVRKDKIVGRRAEPAAFVIRSMEDFPYLRMHNQWVDAMGLRSEADTMITTDPTKALQWLEQRTGQRGLADAMLLEVPS
jgi:hypothetical protein